MPSSPNRENLTAVIVVASSAPLPDGYQLAIAEDLSNIAGIDNPVPLQLDHDHSLRSTIGEAFGFSYDRSPEGLDLLTATIQLQPGPEVERLWPFIESGAVKWSAAFEPQAITDSPAAAAGEGLVTEWRLLEVSAVVVAADPAAITRSLNSPQGGEEIEDMEIIRRPSNYLKRSADLWAAAYEKNAIEDIVTRAWGGKGDQPFWLQLKDFGYRGRNSVEVLRSAMSTSDLPLALAGAGDRQLLARFAEAPQGVRVAAALRQLADYRQASTLDIGLVGRAQKINEGGEITFGNASEQAATYKPSRVGLGLSFTPEAMANDDLGGIQRTFSELGDAALEAEAIALAALLEGNALGEVAPDGKRLFHADHNNTVTGPLSIASLGAAVAKLRSQTTVGGRYLYQSPGALLCSPANELVIRQLLANIQAAAAENVNPWAGLEVAVDPLLGNGFAYLLPTGQRRPLELGRVTPSPRIETRQHFETSGFQIKSEHAFGVAVVDHRPIVRLAV